MSPLPYRSAGLFDLDIGLTASGREATNPGWLHQFRGSADWTRWRDFGRLKKGLKKAGVDGSRPHLPLLRSDTDGFEDSLGGCPLRLAGQTRQFCRQNWLVTCLAGPIYPIAYTRTQQ